MALVIKAEHANTRSSSSSYVINRNPDQAAEMRAFGDYDGSGPIFFGIGWWLTGPPVDYDFQVVNAQYRLLVDFDRVTNICIHMNSKDSTEADNIWFGRLNGPSAPITVRQGWGLCWLENPGGGAG